MSQSVKDGPDPTCYSGPQAFRLLLCVPHKAAAHVKAPLPTRPAGKGDQVGPIVLPWTLPSVHSMRSWSELCIGRALMAFWEPLLCAGPSMLVSNWLPCIYHLPPIVVMKTRGNNHTITLDLKLSINMKSIPASVSHGLGHSNTVKCLYTLNGSSQIPP